LGICVFLVVGVASCTLEKGTEVTQGETAFIQKGNTTLSEIIAHFGPPQKYEIQNNKQFAIYIYRREAASAGNVLATAAGVPQSLSGGPSVKVTVLVVDYDHNNIVNDFSFVERNTVDQPVRVK
jgi:hypothetical protein